MQVGYVDVARLRRQAPLIDAGTAVVDSSPRPCGSGKPSSRSPTHVRFRGQIGEMVGDQVDDLVLALNAMATLRLAALQGVGVVQLPTTVVREDVLEGRLVDVLPQWAPRTAIIHAVFPSRRGLLPSVRAFLDFLALEYSALSRTKTQEGRKSVGAVLVSKADV
jgi:DNA-binding transcriptional LysR family regulator